MRMILRRMAGALLLAVIGISASPPAAICAGRSCDEDICSTRCCRFPHRGNFPLAKRVSIGLGKSLLVQFPFELKDVLVSDPDKVDAVVQASNRVFLIAKRLGPDQCLLLRHQGPADPDAGDRRRRRPQGPRRHPEALRARLQHQRRDGRQAAVLSGIGAHAARRQARRRHRLPVRRRQQAASASQPAPSRRGQLDQRVRHQPQPPRPARNTRPRPRTRPRPAAATPSSSSTCSPSRARSR